ncbi:MAG: hypothetical protein ACI8QC_003429 [Planctomycetota bacterium]|jgi:hypothetical protein
MLRSLLCFGTALVLLALPAAAQSNEATTVCGTLELPDGTPAAGATIAIRGWSTYNRRTQLQAALMNWKSPDPVTADEQGAFTISFPVPRSYHFMLDATLTGFPTERWRFSSLRPGGTKDLETVSFQEPCFVVGHIEGGNGEILVDGWGVSGSSRVDRGRERSPASQSCVPDAASGEFRIGPFPPGLVALYTRSTIMARTEQVQVRAMPGDPVRVVLKYTGPDMRRRVVFTCSSSPYQGFKLEGLPNGVQASGESTLVLMDSDGEVLQHAKKVERSSRDWEFTGVGPGEHVVELRDSRFLPERLDTVIAGQAYSLPLVGAASLQLTVLDQQGKPLQAYGLWVGYEGVKFSPSEYQVRSDGTPAPADGMVTGVVPGNILIEVRGPGGLALRQAVGEVVAGETRHVSVRFGASVPLLGRVLDAAGKPAAGITVEFTRGAYAGSALGISTSIRTQNGTIRIGGIEGSLQADEQGAFRIENLDAGPWTLRAIRSPLAWATLTTKNLAESGPVQLVLPAMGELAGVLRLPTDYDTANLILRAVPADLTRGERIHVNDYSLDSTKVEADGSFRVVGLPYGEIQLTIQFHRDNGDGSRSRQQVHSSRIEHKFGTPPVELDLKESLPASIHVTVLASGKPLQGAGVSFSYGGLLSRSRSGSNRPALLGLFPTLDAVGSFTLEGVDLNQPNRVFLHGPGYTWLFGIPQVFTPKHYGLLECRVELELVERELLLISAAGEPLPNTGFGWASCGYTSPGCRGRTDSNGKATLRMPRGDYELFGSPPNSELETSFEWGRGDGPLIIRWPAPR